MRVLRGVFGLVVLTLILIALECFNSYNEKSNVNVNEVKDQLAKERIKQFSLGEQNDNFKIRDSYNPDKTHKVKVDYKVNLMDTLSN